LNPGLVSGSELLDPEIPLPDCFLFGFFQSVAGEYAAAIAAAVMAIMLFQV